MSAHPFHDIDSVHSPRPADPFDMNIREGLCRLSRPLRESIASRLDLMQAADRSRCAVSGAT